MKHFKPSIKLTDTNSKVVGISVDGHGKIKQVRVQFKLKAEDNVQVLSQPIALNPIEIAWERQPSTL